MGDVEADLEVLSRDPDPAATIAFFAAMDETTRRALAPAARRWLIDEDGRSHASPPTDGPVATRPSPDDRAAFEAWREERHQRQVERERRRESGQQAATVAVLATATPSEMRGNNRPLVSVVTVEALVDRRPDWTSSFISTLLRPVDWKPVSWGAIVRLVRAGLMEVPEDPGLVELLVVSVNGPMTVDERHTERDGWPTRPEQVTANWDVAGEVLWRIFRTPAPSVGDERLTELVIDLGDSGAMRRDRLLDEALAGPGRDDMRPKQLRWFLGLVEALKPSRDELAGRQDAITDLLRADLPAVPAAAIRWLNIVGVAELERPDLVLHGLEAAVLAKTKATANAALKLGGALLDRDPQLADATLDVAALGMGHTDRKVADQAAELAANGLAAVPSERRAGWSARLAEGLSGWPVTEAAAARKHLDLDTDGAASPDDSVGRIDPAADDQIRAQVSALPREVRARWGLDTAVAALDGDPEPPAVIPGSPSLDPLALGDPVAPITDLEELADACGRALEQPDDWLATELAIDALARLGLELGGTRLRALVRQADKVIQRSGPAPSRMLARAICLLADASLHSEALVLSIAGVDEVVAGRTQEIGARLRLDVAGPTLGTPSHAPGWISPEILADRIVAWPTGVVPGHADQICALLRLHGAAIDEPRARLADLAATSPLAARFAYALGADVSWPDHVQPVQVVAEDTRLRLAEPSWPDHVASEAFEERRRRQTAWEAMEELPLQERLAAQRAAHTITHDEHQEQKRQAMAGHLEPRFTSVPTLLLNEQSWTSPHLRWNLTAAPAYPDVVTLGTSGLAPPHLEPLLRPDQPIGSIFPLAMASATNGSDPVLHALAEDVFVQLIDDGRFDPSHQGAVAAHHLTSGHIKANRTTTLLGRVAGTGDLHADEVARMLDHLVSGLDDAPTNAFELLELSDDLHGRCGRAVVDADARASLERWSKGGSRRAKTARQLLDRQAGASPVRAAATRARIQLRLDRAQAAGRATP